MYVYGVVFNWYIIRMSVRSDVLCVSVVMHVLLCLMKVGWCRCY